MANNVKPIPEGYNSIIPYLTVKNAAKAIEFYKKAFGALEGERMTMPDGKIGHTELTIGDSKIMLSDECPGMDAKAPAASGETSIAVHLYVKDVDKTVEAAKKEGAKVTQEVKDQFWGDRNGVLIDPFGHRWFVSTHVEDVKPDEMKRRMEEMFKNAPQQKKAS